MNAAPELLKAAAQGDEQACEQMLRENSGLIWSIVRRYYGRGVEPDDLYQLGCLGFIKAIKGFNFAFGTQFSTYAVPKIAGEIRRFLRDDGAVKVSRSIKERAQGIRNRGIAVALTAKCLPEHRVLRAVLPSDLNFIRHIVTSPHVIERFPC